MKVPWMNKGGDWAGWGWGIVLKTDFILALPETYKIFYEENMLIDYLCNLKFIVKNKLR